MLTNQIAQLEVGNFHKHLPRGGYFLPKAMLIHVLFFSGHGTSRLHHSVSVSTRLTLPQPILQVASTQPAILHSVIGSALVW